MSSPKDICIKDFAYPLPDERIAKYPLPERDRSKLLVWRGGEITDSQFFRLSDYVPQGTLMVFNNTRVIRARLHFRKATGALILPRTPHAPRLPTLVCRPRALHLDVPRGKFEEMERG